MNSISIEGPSETSEAYNRFVLLFWLLFLFFTLYEDGIHRVNIFAHCHANIIYFIRCLRFPKTIPEGDIPFCGSLEHRWMSLVNARTVIQLIWEISKQLNQTWWTLPIQISSKCLRLTFYLLCPKLYDINYCNLQTGVLLSITIVFRHLPNVPKCFNCSYVWSVRALWN